MNKGFTLIELLVTIAIVGILAGLAVAQYQTYKEKAYNSASISDLRNLKTAQEAYYSDNDGYLISGSTNLLPGFLPSADVSSTVTAAGTGDSSSYQAASKHSQSTSLFCYDHLFDDGVGAYQVRSGSSVADCY